MRTNRNLAMLALTTLMLVPITSPMAVAINNDQPELEVGDRIDNDLDVPCWEQMVLLIDKIPNGDGKQVSDALLDLGECSMETSAAYVCLAGYSWVDPVQYIRDAIMGAIQAHRVVVVVDAIAHKYEVKVLSMVLIAAQGCGDGKELVVDGGDQETTSYEWMWRLDQEPPSMEVIQRWRQPPE